MAYTIVDNPELYFQTKLYTGTGSSQTISGVGFQPDWTWIKIRSGADSHSLEDSVRGANKHLRSDSTLAEVESGTAHITSWNSDGFVLGSGDGQVNGSSSTYASWNWLASGSASSNSDGSITSSVSANTTAGFSIVSYTGTGSNATVGHGLGAEAKCIIFKDRDTASDWRMYHVKVGNTGALTLNNNNATQTNSVFFQDTTPTSTVFSLGTGTDVNNTNAFIAYCFAEKKGYSKFGSYTGNGNADGPFVYTGFRPAFLLFKKTSGTSHWYTYDSKRLGYNGGNVVVAADLTNSEITGKDIDLLSNGFKWKSTTNNGNASGATYIYMAFAESPFVNSNGVPNNAR